MSTGRAGRSRQSVYSDQAHSDFPRKMEPLVSTRVQSQSAVSWKSDSIWRTGFRKPSRLDQAILFISALALPCTAIAQAGSNCQAPAALQNALTQHPSAAVYDAIGAHFASGNRFSCAIPAFESAVRLEPNSWQGHY